MAHAMKHDDELTDEQKTKKKMVEADAKAAFLQPKPAGFGHDLLDGHGPILGNGRLTGKATSVKNGLGCHTMSRHDDVYGKDVNGVGFDLFGESFACDGVQEEDFDGDHVKTWRERMLNGLRVETSVENSFGTVYSGDEPEVARVVMEWKYGTWVKANVVYDEHDEISDDDVDYDGSWFEDERPWLQEEPDMLRSRIMFRTDDEDDLFLKYERKWDSGFKKDGMTFQRLDFREINDGLKAQGFVSNPLYQPGDEKIQGGQPRMVPKGALVGMGGVNRCNPHRGKCECHIPTLKVMRKRMKNWNVSVFSNGKKMYWPKPGKSLEDLYTTNMIKYDGTAYTGPTTTLAILTKADRRKSCRAQAHWGKKVVKNQQPLVMHVAKKQVTSWSAALKKRKTKKTTTTTTTENAEPEQQVPQQQRRQSIVW
jgi:hypothetical protein